MHPIAFKASTVLMAAVASLAGSAAIVTYTAGAVRVSVEGKGPQGDHVNIIVPAILVPVALGFVPAKSVGNAETRQWLPTLKAVSQELERCPDATLVEVKSPHEHVTIVKRGNALAIDVDDPGETVHVAFPVGVLRSVINKLEAGNAASNPTA